MSLVRHHLPLLLVVVVVREQLLETWRWVQVNS
jgi:hypothetical protein